MRRGLVTVLIFTFISTLVSCTEKNENSAIAGIEFDVVEITQPPNPDDTPEGGWGSSNTNENDYKEPTNKPSTDSDSVDVGREVTGDSGVESSMNLKYTHREMAVPYLSQRDPKWASNTYDGYTMHDTACGIVSVTMALNYAGIKVMPPDVADWAHANGYYTGTYGSSWALFQAVASKYDLNFKQLSRNNPQEILDSLSAGQPVIASMSPGTFVRSGGHIILLRGIDKDGKILVNDPYSETLSKKSYPFSQIINESSVLGPTCFWAIYK